MKIYLSRYRSWTALIIMAAVMLSGCASVPVPQLRRDGDSKAHEAANSAETELQVPDEGSARPTIRRGSGRVIDDGLASVLVPDAAATTGTSTFNFEGVPVQVVVKAILGDLLGQNYVVAPEVQGTVTLSTPKQVSPAEALHLLEMVLGWNNARMVYSGGRYNIVPADRALAGNVSASIAPTSSVRGYEVRVVPLQYVSATEMEKILKPYARTNGIVAVDNARNLITIGGGKSELESYLRTIQIFDVDWLAGMSVGVFPLRAGKAAKVVSDLEKVFGEQSKVPVAGMFRFMPLEAANAVLVITPQERYLDEIEDWIDRIDGAGDESQMFSHELKYIDARELASKLASMFGGGGGTSASPLDDPSIMPGLEPVTLSDGGVSGSGQASGGASSALPSRSGGNDSVTLDVEGTRVAVTAIEETNSLIVRSTPAIWRSIHEVVTRLDVMPLQVHIEAQVVEVQLGDDLRYGVNWFFERAVTDAGLPNAVGRDTWSTLAGSVSDGGLSWTFLGRNAASVIDMLDAVTDLQLLQSPSVMVRNNAQATLNVGSRIPVTSVSYNPGNGGDGTYDSVQYLETGIILKVRPRVARDGTVFMDIVQEVSSPGTTADKNGNVRVDTRKLQTQAAIQSGDTIILAGMISDGLERSSSGVPGLSRIPVVGALFGSQRTNKRRNEVIVLLTPTIIGSAQQAREITDDYGRRFRALEPLQSKLRKPGPVTLPEPGAAENEAP